MAGFTFSFDLFTQHDYMRQKFIEFIRSYTNIRH